MTSMQHSVGRARLATMVVLFSNGLLYATWGVCMPALKAKFGVSDGVLAVAMAAVALGGILTMGQAGRWIAAVGSGKASVRSGLVMAASAAPILLVPDYYALLPLLVIYGVATAANDVAANSQGSFLEKQAKRSLIGSLHASFSLGGLLGSLLASAWATSALPMAANFWVLGALVAVALVVSSRHLQDEPSMAANGHGSSQGVAVERQPQVRRRLRFFGVLAFLSLVVEGAFYDWAAVYMREIVRAPASWVGLGYAAFAVGMAMGRLSGDKVRDTFPHQAVAMTSALVCIGGLVIVLSGEVPAVVVAGFWVSGVGLSNFIPLLFSSAGRLSRAAELPPSEGLALTTRIAYVGLLAGPLLIGPVAQHFGLRNALALLSGAVAATGLGWLYVSHLSGGAPWDLVKADQPAQPKG